ncbi:MAG: PspC domain-containing protein [Actinomycetota bacterium]|nr:PspC domain-containing protein [Actinomycetota bacterium]
MARGPRRLRRAREGKIIGGVCSGLADYFGVSRRTVRILAVLSIILPGPQVLAYLVMWAIVPVEDRR